MARTDRHATRAVLAAAVILALAVGPRAHAGGQAAAPKLTGLEYAKDRESLDRRTDVQVEGRRIESLTIKARFRDKNVEV